MDGAKSFKYELLLCRYAIYDDNGDLRPVITPDKIGRTLSRLKSIDDDENTPKTRRKSKANIVVEFNRNDILVDIEQRKNIVSPDKCSAKKSIKNVNKLNAKDIISLLSDDENDDHSIDESSPAKRSKTNDSSTELNHSACRNLMDSLNDASAGEDLDTTRYAVVATPKKKNSAIVLTLRKQG